MQNEIPDVTIPSYYVVGRQLTEAQIYTVLQAFSLTPISCAIVSSIMDAEYARTFSEEIVSVTADARTLAKQLADNTGTPPLIIGDADILDAYYADGSKEKIV